MGECRFVGNRDQRNRVLVREMAHFPRKVNGYPGGVPTTEVVVSRQNKMSKRFDPNGHHRRWTRAGPAGYTVWAVRTVGRDSGTMSGSYNLRLDIGGS